MKTSMFMTAAASVALACTATTWAGPLLQANSVTALGGGLYRVEVGLDLNDVTLGSNKKFAFENMTFSGATFNQSKPFGVLDVNKLSDANTFNGQGGYSKAQDSFYYDNVLGFDFNGIGGQQTNFTGTSMLRFSGGSATNPTGDAFDGVGVFQIVVSGTAPISYSGGIAMGGINYGTASGVLPIPEPASLALGGLGLLTICARRRLTA